jgi:amino acid adenylation domain-containing protein
METGELLSRAVAAGVFLYIEDGKLKFRTKRGTFPDELREQIREHKDELNRYLQQLEGRRASFQQGLPPLTRRAVTADAPLSFSQQRLWFVDQLQGSAQYNMTSAVRVSGELNISALEKAIGTVVERHEIIRTRFAIVGGEPVQRVSENCTVPLIRSDLSALRSGEQDARLREIAREEALAPFDLSRDLLLRVQLIKLAEQMHVLQFKTHHIVADGWSTSVLIRELNALYAAYIRGEPSPLPALPVQYADFACWQRSWLQGELLDRQLQYWRARLQGVQTLMLPTDRPRPTVASFRGDSVAFSFPPALTEGLWKLSQQEGVTLFMVLLAGLQVVLARQSGQTDIAIGAPVAGRGHRELEGMIGCFVNTLVLRADLSGNPRFDALIQQVKDLTLSAYANQDVPFEMLVAELQPERDLSRQPLYQVAFAWQNFPSESLELAGLRWQAVGGQHTTAKYDLLLQMYETSDGLRGSLEYAVDLFDRSTVSRFISQLERVLTQVAMQPRMRLSEMQLLDPQERQRLLNDCNQTTVAFGPDSCIHELFQEQAQRTPTAVALRCDGQELTYAELDGRSNRLARYLMTFGVGPDVVVALCVERSFDMLVGLLGVLKAGGAYLPMDSRYPQARLQFMLEDAAVSVLLTQEGLEEYLPQFSGRTIALDSEWPLIALGSASSCANLIDTRNLAYVIYTSGSTGLPKGSMLTHASVVNYLRWARQHYRLDAGVGAPVNTSFAFDATVTSLLTPLLAGGCVELLSSQEDDISSLGTALSTDTAYSLVKLTPSHLRALQERWPRSSATRAGAFVIGGEALSADDVRFWREHAPSVRLINEYGPTETVVGCAIYEVGPVTAAQRAVPIGRPIANMRLYVLDEFFEPVPPGAVGELFIGGVGVARGYINRAALTAERFIADPFSGDGSRLYRTGDRARYLSDGNLEYLGRMDEQLKIRGHRVEPAEIEAALRQQPGIRQAVVTAREDASAELRLVAYLLPSAPLETEDEELLTQQKRTLALRCMDGLKTILPHYMVPTAFVIVEQLPLTINGKIDRGQLPAPGEGDIQQRTYSAPRNELEATLCAIWDDVLGIGKVGIDDDFFALGGHSLLATRLISQIRERLALEVPLRAVFRERTPAGLASVLPEFRSEQRLPRIEAADRRGPLLLSFAQQRLWFIDQLGQGSAQYNLVNAFKLVGVLEVSAFEKAMRRIVERHEVLRTSFAVEAGEPRQIIKAQFDLPLSRMDLRNLSETEQVSYIAHLAKQDESKPFDLTRDILLRVMLLQLSAREHVVLINQHHIASDGWSMGVLIREFNALYGAFSQGLADPLPPLPVQYADYAQWQRQWLQGDVLNRQLRYWRQRLAGIPQVHSLPLDKPRPTRQGFTGAVHSQSIAPPSLQQLNELCQAHDVTLFMLLHAVFSVVLGRYSNASDIVVGSAISGRVHRDTEALIGFFVNDLVLRSEVHGERSFISHLENTRQSILDAYTHQSLPFEMLVEELKPERSLQHPPIVQIRLDLQNNERAALDAPGIELEPLKQQRGLARYDLYVIAAAGKHGLSLEWQYADDLFLPESIERLAGSFANVLANVVRQPDTPLHALELITETQRQRITVQWNETHARYPRGRCIHELIEEQAYKTPGAVAVACGELSVSYSELVVRANNLAHLLRARGVTAESLVAVCLERDIDMMVALLAIMKAGGAYLPLDLTYPHARLSFMLQDSRAQYLLTQESLLARQGSHLPQLLSGFEGVCLRLNTLAQELATLPTTAVSCEVGAANLAYVIYTSGSTGQPKAVMVTHVAVINILCSVREQLRVEAVDRLLALTTLSFDIAALELFMPLLAGATVILADRMASSEPQRLMARIEASGATLMQATPTSWQLLLDSGWTGKPDLKALCGGEALSSDMAKRLSACVHSLWNMYGPTETTIWSCDRRVDRADQSAGIESIGRPLANTQAYVLDEYLQPVPVGVVGELYLGGDGVARGYLRRGGLTAQRFIANPFATDAHAAGTRLYRTGDRGWYRADGTLQFVGRADNQVKIRGLRIELGEVEARLAKCAGVRDAVVVAREDSSGDKHLVAYVVPQSGSDHAVDLSLFFVDEESAPANEKYGFCLTAAQIADSNGFEVIRTPARHFDAEGVLASSKEAFAVAGELGENVLTQLLGQTIDHLAHSIEIYRKARAEHGHDPAAGRVTVMLHTFMGEDHERTVAAAKEPFLQHLRRHQSLMEALVRSSDLPMSDSSPKALENLIEVAIERSLIGTPQSCLPVVQKLDDIGVTEIGCLVDWVDGDSALEGLRSLKALKDLIRQSRLDTTALRRSLETQLPAYMVPSAFVVLDGLPLTPNGKINRVGLPAPAPGPLPDLHDAAVTPTQQVLVGIWSSVLGLKGIGVKDNFFEVGGHSIKALKVIVQICERFQISVPLSVMFQFPTVEQMATAIEGMLSAAVSANSASVLFEEGVL